MTRSGHELILVDREANKKLCEVNKYWNLAISRKIIFTVSSV